MKRMTKLVLCLVAFGAAQAVVAALLFIGTKTDIVKSFRDGVEYNFAQVVQSLESKINNGQELTFDDVYLYNFENILIIENDGKIRALAKTDQDFTVGGNAHLDISTLSQATTNQTPQLIEYTLNGNGVLLLSKNLQPTVTVIAFESLEFEKSLLYTFTLRLAFSSIILFIAVSIIASLFFEVYGNREGNAVRFSQNMFGASSSYIFEINKKGVFYKNKHGAFGANYDIENIADHYVSNNMSLSKALSDKVPFSLLLTSRSGDQNYFRCIATRSPRGYKILAMDDSEHSSENRSAVSHVFLEPTTGLRNKNALESDIAEFLEEDRKQASIVFFNICNLETLETLFSSSTKEKILKSCAGILRNEYNSVAKLYFVDENKFVVFAHTGGEEIKRGLSDFNANLNAIIRNEGNNVQILTNVTFLYIDSTEKYTLSELIEYSEYIRMNLKDRINSSIISEIFTKSKYRYAVGNKKNLTRKIIESNSFQLFYQPQYRLGDNKIVAFESLVRLINEPSLTTQDFILISEANGFMLQLGEQIMQKAFEFASKIESTGIPICINLSPVQLLNKGFVDSFTKSYEKHKLSQKSIALEITETFLMRDVAENIKKLEIIHRNGICIHLDDFGMGYSSLAYLKNIPLDAIKIDREFVSAIDKDEYSKAICRFIVATARQLGKETIAEGVETQAQYDALKKIGCDIVQGYLTGRPISEENALALLRQTGANV